MSGLNPEKNPFKPGIGKTPPIIAGRKREMSTLQEAIDELVPGAGGGPNEIVMFGPRGVGKTVLLDWAERRCLESGKEDGGVRVIKSRPKMGLNNPANIVRLLLEPGRVGKTLKLMGFRYRPPDNLKIGNELVGEAEWAAPETPFYDPLVKEIMDECRKRPKALLVDEAHNLNPVAKEILFTISSFVSAGAPFLLVLAGTPGLYSRLTDSGETYIECATKMPVRNLDPESAKRAISEPCEKTGLTVDAVALEHVISDAQLYPFFLQVWGKHLWDHAKGRGSKVITMDDAVNADVVRSVEEEREGMYEGRYNKFLEKEHHLPAVEAIVAAFRAGTRINKRKLIQTVEDSLPKTLENRHEKALSIAREIESSDLVWCPRKTFIPGIPSFMAHIHENTLEHEPANTPDAFSKLRGFEQTDDNDLER